MKIHANLSVGEIVRQARLRVGHTQDTLADQLGVSIFVLNRVEMGRRSFDTDWVSRMPGVMRPLVRAGLIKQLSDDLAHVPK